MDYVRLTFVPAGGTRPVTVWARRIGGQCVFEQLNSEGDELDPRHLIFTSEGDYTARPARMNMRYATLEVARPKHRRRT